ncbi:MAG TPA: hydantoinase/oxoprolinase family protein [Thermomicrobiales bacterium]|nr:hydantoinase/oxoprolinase family protein [Thermomicrobiales bacterium]
MDGTRIGIDIGGTFTDFLLFDGATGRFSIAKTLTTPDEPARAVSTGIGQLSDQTGLPVERVEQIVHGTTLVTNALIERKGAVTALITTKGFRDALEIAREHRYDLYDLFLEPPTPLVPRYLRLEMDERILSDGSISTPVDLDELPGLLETIRQEGATAVAVSFLHSYQNPEHERGVFERLQELAPELVYSVSSDVAPEIREYERTSTTVANVYVRPLAERYIAGLIDTLANIGFHGSLFIMLSSGGLSSPEAAARYPIRLVESGPAAGALAAAHIGKLSGREQLLAFDMGGTTAKACLVGRQGLTFSDEFEVSRVYRFKKGSGLPVSVPVIELIEIGSGGGSIARIDSLGLLKVGPDSAGAMPGPACYGRGGTQPTVTDADLVLGYLDPDHFLGGKMPLDLEKAATAIARIAEPLGLSVTDAAWGIHQVVNEQMAGAARIHAIERGEDARAFPLFAFGGAGPVHAYGVASILRSPEVIVPFGAGVASTIGFLVAPISFDFVRTYVGKLDILDWPEVAHRFNEMRNEGEAMLTGAGTSVEQISYQRFAELRYVGQGHQIKVRIPEGEFDISMTGKLLAEFEAEYKRLYGRVATGNPVEAINWRLVAAAPSPHLPLDMLAAEGAVDSTRARKGTRRAFVPELGSYQEIPVYDRYALGPDFATAGPAIIEENESTIVVGGEADIRVDAFSNVIVKMPFGSS